MTISIPDTLTSDNSEKYIMSIRLRSGGLSFSGYVPSVRGSFFYREVEFDRAVSYISSLKEFFFAHEFLSWMYKRINVICVSPEYTLVPSVYLEETKGGQILDFVFSGSAQHCLRNTLAGEQSELLFGLDEEVYEFCSRSLLHPYFTHYMTPLLKKSREKSLLCPVGQMYVVLEQKRMDVVCYAQSKRLYQNGFKIEQTNDIVYYLLYIWKRIGFDQQKDQLLLCGNVSFRNEVRDLLKAYVKQVESIQIPSEAFLLGEDILKAPMDLISLVLCE